MVVTSSLLSLSISGLLITVAYPFDLIRNRMQTMQQLIHQKILSSPYKNINDCFRRVMKEEGIRAFWKGNMSNLIRFYPNETLNFAMKNFVEQVGKKAFRMKNHNQNTFWLSSFSGIVGGWITLFILYPFQYTRTKMSTDINNTDKSIRDCLKKVYKKQGLSGIFRGASLSLYSVTIFRGIYFGIYDSYKHNSSFWLDKLLISYISILLANLLTYPMDLLRRRLMLTSGQPKKYQSMFDLFSSIKANQGLKGFVRGWPIVFVQSVMGSAILYLYDKIFQEIKKAGINQ